MALLVFYNKLLANGYPLVSGSYALGGETRRSNQHLEALSTSQNSEQVSMSQHMRLTRLTPNGHEMDIEIMIQHQMLFFFLLVLPMFRPRWWSHGTTELLAPGSLQTHCARVNSISWNQKKHFVLSKKLMWVKGCYKPHINHPFGNDYHTNYITGDLVLFFTHISGFQMHWGIHSSNWRTNALTNAWHTGACICPNRIWDTSQRIYLIYLYIQCKTEKQTCKF